MFGNLKNLKVNAKNKNKEKRVAGKKASLPCGCPGKTSLGVEVGFDQHALFGFATADSSETPATERKSLTCVCVWVGEPPGVL